MSYDKETFEWVFRVPHYTPWGDYDEEDDEDDNND
jgi:hypothetical protein